MLRKIVVSVILIFLIGMAGCGKDEAPKKISLEKGRELPAAQPDNNVGHLRVAIGGMITSKEALPYYKLILDYLGEKLGAPVAFIDRENYADQHPVRKR